MVFLKKIFRLFKNDTSDDIPVTLLLDFYPDKSKLRESSLFDLLSDTSQNAILSDFKGFNKRRLKHVFKEVLKVCAMCEDPDALNTLATLYVNGIGVRQDTSKALELLCEAAKRGSVLAMYNIGRYYNSDLGGNDIEAALQWYKKSSRKGFLPSELSLGKLYMKMGNITHAKKCFYNAAVKGNSEAEFIMGTLYTNGIGVGVHNDEAFKWFLRAAKNGYPRAQSILAACYANGLGVIKDEQQMAYWYSKAAEHGDEVALRGMYMCYYYGMGVGQDDEKARNCLNLAKQYGFIEAGNEIGWLEEAIELNSVKQISKNDFLFMLNTDRKTAEIIKIRTKDNKIIVLPDSVQYKNMIFKVVSVDPEALISVDKGYKVHINNIGIYYAGYQKDGRRRHTLLSFSKALRCTLEYDASPIIMSEDRKVLLDNMEFEIKDSKKGQYLILKRFKSKCKVYDYWGSAMVDDNYYKFVNLELPKSLIVNKKELFLREIADYACSEAGEIVSVVIPDSVKRIGANAFSGCINMEKVYIPYSVSFIGSGAFSAFIEDYGHPCGSLKIVYNSSSAPLDKNVFWGQPCEQK